MNDNDKPNGARPPKRKSIGRQVFDFLSSFGLASVLFALLLTLTWLGTLEQTDKGLYLAVKKYFGHDSVFIFPEIRLYAEQKNPVKIPIPLLGGYWVSLLLLVNMFLGGVIRARKGIRSLGALISHFAIIFMLIGGAVTYHFSDRGNMAIHEGAKSDVAEAYQEWAIEIQEQETDAKKEVHVIGDKSLNDLRPHDIRKFKLANLPFDLEIVSWTANAQPVNALELAPQKNETIVDSYYIRAEKSKLEAEANLAACYAKVILKNGTVLPPFILAGASYHPKTIEVDGKKYTINLRKQLWPMPFTVTLKEFTHEFDPGTKRAAKYESEILRTEDNTEVPVKIEMNEPMRYKGYTFFQASWGPQDGKPGEKLFSVFEVVNNPADKWPEWSLYAVMVGMLIQFLIKLTGFVERSSKQAKKNG